jgi:hypothetical protein
MISGRKIPIGRHERLKIFLSAGLGINGVIVISGGAS